MRSLKSITTFITPSQSANSSSTPCLLESGRWHVWHGLRPHGTWGHAIASLAGAVKRGGGTSDLSHITPAFSCCPGFGFLVWRPTFWAAWRRRFRGIGNAFTDIPFTTWKRSSTGIERGPVIGRRTGSRWDGQRAAGKHRIVTGPIVRSSKYWD